MILFHLSHHQILRDASYNENCEHNHYQDTRPLSLSTITLLTPSVPVETPKKNRSPLFIIASSLCDPCIVLKSFKSSSIWLAQIYDSVVASVAGYLGNFADFLRKNTATRAMTIRPRIVMDKPQAISKARYRSVGFQGMLGRIMVRSSERRAVTPMRAT